MKNYQQRKLSLLRYTMCLLGSLGSGAAYSDSMAEMFYLGLDLSFLRLNTSYQNELNKTGFSVLPKAGFFYEDESIEIESGLGFRYSQLSGTQLGVTKKLKFRSGLFDFNFRLKAAESFSIGPMLQYAFGTDMSHTETPQTKSSGLFMGGVSARQRLEDSPISLTFHALVDFNLSKQVLWGLGAGVLFHFPEKGSASAPAPTPYAESAQEPVAAAPVQQFVPYSNPRPEVEYGEDFILIRLPEDVLLFPTAVSTLNNQQKEYVRKLGEVLNNNQADWKKIIVIGHTDFLGTHSYNDNLSRDRARSVKTALEDSGTDPERITAVGRGKREPLSWESDKASLSKNRRVEIKLEGVKSNSVIGEQLQAIDPAS